MIGRVSFGALVLAVATAAPAAAQSGVGIRGYVTYGVVQFAAADTFKAVSGSASTTSVGGGAQVTGLWRGLFADVGFSRQHVDGERVFVDGTTVYPLGIPLRVRTRPVDVAAGWRVAQRRFAVYVGAGLSSIGYTETGDFAQAGEDVSERANGGLVLAGADVPVGRYVAAGAELRYRAVTGVLGGGGASAAFGEDQVGGVSYALRVSIGR